MKNVNIAHNQICKPLHSLSSVLALLLFFFYSRFLHIFISFLTIFFFLISIKYKLNEFIWKCVPKAVKKCYWNHKAYALQSRIYKKKKKLWKRILLFAIFFLILFSSFISSVFLPLLLSAHVIQRLTTSVLF